MNKLKAHIQRPRLSSDWTDADYLAKLISRCTVLPNGCWEIDGAHNKSWKAPGPGYGAMSYRCKTWPAHKLSFFLHNGHIDHSLDVMHSCDYPPCCNPAHLSQGTRGQNIRDAIKRRRGHKAQLQRDKTHCPKGHDYAVYGAEIPNKGGWIQRACIMCGRIRSRKKAGWPQHLWEIPPQKLGTRPHLPHPKLCSESIKEGK